MALPVVGAAELVAVPASGAVAQAVAVAIAAAAIGAMAVATGVETAESSRPPHAPVKQGHWRRVKIRGFIRFE